MAKALTDTIWRAARAGEDSRGKPNRLRLFGSGQGLHPALGRGGATYPNENDPLAGTSVFVAQEVTAPRQAGFGQRRLFVFRLSFGWAGGL